MAFTVTCAACTTAPQNINIPTKSLKPTPARTPFVPKNGDYQGRGKVTRIELKGGSVELDHEEIPDAMPAMKMEFFVSDKAMLNGLKLGDEVDFTLRYNNGQETIVAISKIR
jgi:Cu(I)/Ag(I) efflux system periplasmic protein CusF